MTARLGRRGLAAGLLAVAVGAGGCGARPATPGTSAVLRPDGGGPDLSDVIYAGQATDDALLRLLALPAQKVAGWGLAIASPSSQATLPAASPVAFAYSQTTAQLRRPSTGAFRRAFAELVALLGPERSAQAHGTPFNGTGTLLVVTDATGSPRLRVFTGQSSFMPDDAQWAGLGAGPQPLTLTLTWAEFDDNRIPDGYGPFSGGAVQFRIEPP